MHELGATTIIQKAKLAFLSGSTDSDPIMSEKQNIDGALRDWAYQPGVISARTIAGEDDRQVLQMRIEMGVLQMELTGRPDGERPDGEETYLDILIQRSLRDGEAFELTEDECFEVDREFLQFYHRRICLLALREFEGAVRDADHTLALMDLALEHSPDADWSLSHEQYRPFVLFHRTQAVALQRIQASDPAAAIEEINGGLKRMRGIFSAMDVDDRFDEDPLVGQLVELKESLRQEHSVGKTLAEQLADAIAAEQYERAAELRDKISRRSR